MYLKRNNFTHPINDALVSLTKVPVYADNRVLIGSKDMWSIRGMLTGADATELSAKMIELEAAYSSIAGDLVLLQNDASTETHLKTTGSQTVGGIRCTKLYYPMTDPGDFTTYLHYEIECEADFGGIGVFGAAGGQGGGGEVIVSWTETVSYQGDGGPREILLEAINGPPQLQVVSDYTPIFATQQGDAVGLFKHPTPARPIYPQYEIGHERRIAYSTPTMVGGTQNGPQTTREFRSSWSYSFQASQPLTAKPGLGF